MTVEREENPLVQQKLPELKEAEPWLEWKSRRFASRCFHGDEEAVQRVTFELQALLRQAYLEGYSDRMKSEIKELQAPERKPRRKK